MPIELLLLLAAWQQHMQHRKELKAEPSGRDRPGAWLAGPGRLTSCDVRAGALAFVGVDRLLKVVVLLLVVPLDSRVQLPHAPKYHRR